MELFYWFPAKLLSHPRGFVDANLFSTAGFASSLIAVIRKVSGPFTVIPPTMYVVVAQEFLDISPELLEIHQMKF
ncbi:hypothetical protein [Pedobacter sp. SYSU D00535]|uniref:hypothetical protein n=1 Tax=Pedobacter sp. SYSU D00535 TaxID=2810308 RepID=UPI001A956A95|nr:hypothetical protein [Pedobacter sp. SYSU D00535]